jgi:hypothetical protein
MNVYVLEVAYPRGREILGVYEEEASARLVAATWANGPVRWGWWQMHDLALPGNLLIPYRTKVGRWEQERASVYGSPQMNLFEWRVITRVGRPTEPADRAVRSQPE